MTGPGLTRSSVLRAALALPAIALGSFSDKSAAPTTGWRLARSEHESTARPSVAKTLAGALPADFWQRAFGDRELLDEDLLATIVET